jgi:hypothetical protein
VARLNLRDAQWEQMAHLLPGKPGDRGRLAADNRWFVEAVLWMARVFSALAEDADFEEIVIDSTIVRVLQHAAGAQKKMARRRLAARAAG